MDGNRKNASANRQEKNKSDWSDKTILVADDAKINYLLFKTMLGNTRANVIWAKDGKGAVDICKSGPVDLVLMDYQMPGMNGLEASLRIKKMKENMPVISQSSSREGSQEFASICSGCDDFIIKPVKKEHLLAKLGRYLNG